MEIEKKPTLSFWQIWNMSFGFLGIQFGFALQNANVSRIFETLGADVNQIPILWIAAPATGLIVQPIIGHMSDRTWGKLGRRRPYFLIGAILASLALLAMPNSPALWFAAGMLWILDASINISMEPFRALVGDMLPSSQRTLGFALQSFFIGLGAIIASALPWIFTNLLKISNTAPAGQIPPSVKYSFYIGGVVFIAAVLWTVLRTKEYSPEELKKYSPPFDNEHEHHEGFGVIIKDFFRMPKTMVQLAFVQFFTWFALFSMWIYTTPAVTRHIFHATDTSSAAYNHGADWVGVCFAVYNGLAGFLALLFPPLVKVLSRKGMHAVSLIAGGLGLVSMYFITDPHMLLISMVGVGLAWASILSMPYAILAGALPANKMGVYMGIFNFFIVIPQILAASIWGFVTSHFFNGEAIFAVVSGGCSMILAATLVLFVQDDHPKK